MINYQIYDLPAYNLPAYNLPAFKLEIENAMAKANHLLILVIDGAQAANDNHFIKFLKNEGIDFTQIDETILLDKQNAKKFFSTSYNFATNELFVFLTAAKLFHKDYKLITKKLYNSDFYNSFVEDFEEFVKSKKIQNVLTKKVLQDTIILLSDAFGGSVIVIDNT